MGRGFINFDANRVASGLKRLVDAGIGTIDGPGGVPSFDNESIAKFLAATGQSSPGTIPTSPLNQAPSNAAVDGSVKFSRDLNGLLEIDSRIAELTIQKNNIAAKNLENLGMDIEVSSAKQALTDATSNSMFNFDPTQDDAFKQKQQVAQAQMNLAEKNAEVRIQRQTALDLVPLDNELLRLATQRQSLDLLIKKEERDESVLPIAVQQATTAFENLTDPADLDKTWEVYSPDKKTLVTEASQLAKNDAFEWADPLIDVDRKGYIDFLKARIKPGPKTDSFNALLPQMNTQLAAARKKAEEDLVAELSKDVLNPLLNDRKGQIVRINQDAAQIMRDNTDDAWDVYVPGASWESITRDGFSSDETWQVAQTMQANIDPSQPTVSAAITEVLDRMPPMDIDFRTQVIKEYVRKQQDLFNSPRRHFGMGIDQGTIDALGDSIASNMVLLDKIRARESIIRDDIQGLQRRFGRTGTAAGAADVAAADFSTIGRGAAFTRARASSIARSTQNALDAALRAATPTEPRLKRFRGVVLPGQEPLGVETGPASTADLRTAVNNIMQVNPGLSVEEATSMALNPNVNASGQQPTAGFTEEDLANLSEEEQGLLDQLLNKVRKTRPKPTRPNLQGRQTTAGIQG